MSFVINNMGKKSSKSKPDEPNPISGLTKRDIVTIKRTWAPVFKKADVYGIELFKRFFRADPETKLLFYQIKGQDESQLANNKQFKRHVINFMRTFNAAVQKLHDPDRVVAAMRRLGDYHRKRSVPKKHFDTLKNVFVNFLANDLNLDSSAMDSWSRFIGFIYPNIFATLNG